MNNQAIVTVLGCGTSGGVPQLFGGWGQCDPEQPRNRRHRSSILIEQQQHSILVDTTPECRLQLMDHDISKIKAVLYTHTHADHSNGIDETRWICMAGRNALDAYGFAEHLADLQKRFDYAWSPLRQGATGYYKPVLVPHIIHESQPFQISGIPFEPLRLDHGFSEVLGFRIGDFAYTTDVLALLPEQIQRLQGVKTWIVDSLRYDPHPTHAHLERTLDWIAQVQPQQAYLTHMNNDMDYDTLCRTLPNGVLPAHDGLQCAIQWPSTSISAK